MSGKNVRDAIGKTIRAIHHGPWKSCSGARMRGIASGIWGHCDVFLTLNDRAILQLSPNEVCMAPDLPHRALHMNLIDEIGKDCIGARVTDILQGQGPQVLTLLHDGRYIEHSHETGGSNILLDALSCWPDSELGVVFQSLTTGARLSARTLKRKYE